MSDLSHWELHEMGECGGLGGCPECDVQTAARMKEALNPTLCRICSGATTTAYCDRCLDKLNQRHNERLLDAVIASDYERERYK